MPPVDLNITDVLELSLKFHAEGSLVRAVQNYRLILEVLETSEGEDRETERIRWFTQHVLAIAMNDIDRAYGVKCLVAETIKKIDNSLKLPYKTFHLMEAIRREQSNEASKLNMLLRIQGWTGRLGNNLLQLSHAMSVAKHTQSILILPEHDFLNMDETGHIIAYTSQPITSQWSDTFFDVPDSLGYQFSSDSKRQALRSLPDTFYNFTPDPKITDHTLVIHLRSGDVFSGSVGNQFWQPPTAFYRRIISSGAYDDIVIVTEEKNMSPCAAQLVQDFADKVKRIRIQTGSLQEDINTLLSARNLVPSNSSFAFTLALASRHIKRWYRFIPSCEKWDFESVPDIEQIDWISPEYPGDVEWSNVDMARQLMLDYPDDKIFQKTNSETANRQVSGQVEAKPSSLKMPSVMSSDGNVTTF